MSRAVDAGVEADTLAESLYPIFLVEMQFSGGTVNFWTGFGNLSWDGKTWAGVGNFGKVSPVEETIRVRAAGVKFVLSGIPSDILAIAFNQTYQGRPALFYFGTLDVDAKLTGDPTLVFSGRMDVMEIDEQETTATISMTIENELIDLERPRVFRYTPEDHKKYFTDDTFFDQVSTIQDVVLKWGRT